MPKRPFHDVACALAALAISPLAAGPLLAQNATSFTNTGAIDRTVENFTGAPVGQPGGALRRVDPRLRLAACGADLQAQWHGTPGRTVRVACPDQPGWHIFVMVQQDVAQARSAPIVRRGDPITLAIRGRGFSIRQSGEAAENGAAGDWIMIRMARGSQPVRARIERAGLAVIERD